MNKTKLIIMLTIAFVLSSIGLGIGVEFNSGGLVTTFGILTVASLAAMIFNTGE